MSLKKLNLPLVGAHVLVLSSELKLLLEE